MIDIDWNKKNQSENEPLGVALMNKNYEMAMFLINNCDVNFDYYVNPTIKEKGKHYSGIIVEELPDKIVEVICKMKNSEHLVFEAAERGMLNDLIDKLNGLNAKERDGILNAGNTTTGNTIFHAVVKAKNFDFNKVLHLFINE